MDKQSFFAKAIPEAMRAGVPFPEYQSCEVAVETGWCKSELCTVDNNLFGMKQHAHPIYGTVSLPTSEFEMPGVDLDGDGIKGEGWVKTTAAWVKYPDWAASFLDRMETLKRLAPHMTHYAAALTAKTGEEFVIEVSKSWSSDPERAAKVLATYRANAQLIQNVIYTAAAKGANA